MLSMRACVSTVLSVRVLFLSPLLMVRVIQLYLPSFLLVALFLLPLLLHGPLTLLPLAWTAFVARAKRRKMVRGGCSRTHHRQQKFISERLSSVVSIASHEMFVLRFRVVPDTCRTVAEALASLAPSRPEGAAHLLDCGLRCLHVLETRPKQELAHTCDTIST